MEEGIIYLPYILKQKSTVIIDGYYVNIRKIKLYKIYGLGEKPVDYSSKILQSRYKKISI